MRSGEIMNFTKLGKGWERGTKSIGDFTDLTVCSMIIRVLAAYNKGFGSI